mmetsp:Transcript_6349/g.11592  ORF Transcript_6349/g.11592 Transcript_6349/m.11592 type:complete len:202 (+) Transcript_6349:256-861(+)
MVDTQSKPPTNKYNGKMTKPTATDSNVETLMLLKIPSPSPSTDEGKLDAISLVFAFQSSTFTKSPHRGAVARNAVRHSVRTGVIPSSCTNRRCRSLQCPAPYNKAMRFRFPLSSAFSNDDSESRNTSMARSFRFSIKTPPLLVSAFDCPPTNTCPNTNRRAVPQFPVSSDRNTGAAMGEMGPMLLVEPFSEARRRRDWLPM